MDIKIRSALWSIFASLLVVSVSLNRNLTDLLFVLMSLVVVCFDSKNGWNGLKATFSKLKYANYLVIAWVAANTLGYFFSTEIGILQINEILGLRWVLCFYLCVYLGLHMRVSERFVRLTALGCALALLYGIYFQYYIQLKSGRFEGVFGNPNVAGFCMAIPWAFLVGWESVKYFQTRKTDWLLILINLAIAGMIFYTYGRAVWISICLVFIFVSVLLKSVRNGFVVVCLLLSAGYVYQKNILGVKDRILYSFDSAEGTSQGTRIRLWQVNWAIFLDHPVAGIGYLENYRAELPYYEKLGMTNFQEGGLPFNGHAHSQFLQELVGGGIIGFVSFCSLFFGLGFFFYRSFRRCTELHLHQGARFAMGGFCVLLVFLLMGIVDCPLVIPMSRNSFLLIMGLSIGATLSKDQESIDKS